MDGCADAARRLYADLHIHSAYADRCAVAKLGWAMEKTIEGHFQRIVDRLNKGRELIVQLLKEKKHTPFDIPDVEPAMKFFSLQPPKAGDPYVSVLTISLVAEFLVQFLPRDGRAVARRPAICTPEWRRFHRRSDNI